ncbi:glucose/arabinose dehydrogenase [Aquimarina sp. MAR_2010_214]|uniref:PQQ-dependent sugar dehydrogenase n=1 Tax=Aquimarina sp. MAR_2010_214 TaxID=1250026 RepID=UPI000C711B78|nr:PQQ-dependent sugar dehydrogenase [Aquimarina sp. MAR_2010_214]PKV50140.1 glucose/arabinose dehydrogenase [Aquimarina sp. MAR_2010_214]
MKFSSFLIFLTIVFSACAQQQKENDITLEDDPKNYTTEVIVPDLQIPWGMAWLPDGSMLITEKSGELIHFKNGNKTSVGNVPEVYNRNQGGLLDIELHPNYKENGWLYITYSSKEGTEKGGNTALIRAKLKNNQLTSIEKLYKGTPNTTKGHHFGSRIEFDNEGYLYFSIGDRGNRDVNPQDITRDGGKIYRLNDDGTIPKDNPFVTKNGAKKAIFSYGHRNPQGMAIHPNGTIWVHEHGPRGGDEINPIIKGTNYGWPVITYGINYSGTSITDITKKEGMKQPLYYWVPSIAPSGMDFITSDIYPRWKNNLLVGSLKFQYLELLELTNNKVTERKKLLDGVGRIRNVRQGPDGFIYVAVENKGILKIIPN